MNRRDFLTGLGATVAALVAVAVGVKTDRPRTDEDSQVTWSTMDGAHQAAWRDAFEVTMYDGIDSYTYVWEKNQQRFCVGDLVTFGLGSHTMVGEITAIYPETGEVSMEFYEV